jgi:DNA primase
LISEDDIRRIHDATDIVELVSERVVLKQRGREFWGCCPFHNEKTPSFKVDPTSQLYHCFGCGEGGSVFTFLMKLENIDFPDAVRALAQRSNIEIAEEHSSVPKGRKARLLAVCEETTSFYHQQLMRVKSPESDAARTYLAKRGMSGEAAKQWQLGFAPGSGSLVRHLQQKGFTRDEIIDANVAPNPDGAGRQLRDRFYNRIMFPLADLHGRTIAFGGRIIGAGEPKYLNSSETLLFHKRDNLYAIDKAKATITTKDEALIVEGYTDVIAMHAAGFTNTVATLGTALTPEHIKLLARFTKRIVLLFDGDEAGQRAADRAADLITVLAAPEVGRKADLFVAVLPGTMDPADFCAEKPAEEMQALLDTSVPLLRFALDRRLARWDLTKPEQRSRALDDVVQLLVPLKGSLLAADYLNYLADVFAVDYQTLATALGKAKPLPSLRSTFDEPATQQSLQTARPASDPAAEKIASFERELLFLYIEQSEVRERLREAFTRIPWGSAEHKAAAEALVGFEANAQPGELLSRLTAHLPSAAGVLSGARLQEFSEVPPNRLAGMLMFNIKEEQLKRDIRTENARLRLLSEEEAQERDTLFESIAKLQQELSELRRKYHIE